MEAFISVPPLSPRDLIMMNWPITVYPWRMDWCWTQAHKVVCPISSIFVTSVAQLIYFVTSRVRYLNRTSISWRTIMARFSQERSMSLNWTATATWTKMISAVALCNWGTNVCTKRGGTVWTKIMRWTWTDVWWQWNSYADRGRLCRTPRGRYCQDGRWCRYMESTGLRRSTVRSSELEEFSTGTEYLVSQCITKITSM